jgi:hypothetical protein
MMQVQFESAHPTNRYTVSGSFVVSHVPVVHSPFAASLLEGWPNVSVIPCMLPDEFYEPLPAPVKLDERRHRYVYGSAAMKGLAPTLELWRELKRSKSYHWRKAELVVCSPGYDAIDPKLLEGCRDVVVHHGLYFGKPLLHAQAQPGPVPRGFT